MTAQFGPFTLDVGTRRLTRRDEEIHLTPKAFDLLTLLVEKAPRVVRKSEIHERLWPGTYVSDATLMGLVKELRRAVVRGGADAALIRTAHRVGYALDAQVDMSRPQGSAARHWIVAGDRQVVLHDGDNVIGRDSASDVWLDSGSVSRRHARVRVDGSTASVEDVGSKNGTTVNGQPVVGTTPLRDGARVDVGSVSIVYRTSSSGMSTVTRVP